MKLLSGISPLLVMSGMFHMVTDRITIEDVKGLRS